MRPSAEGVKVSIMGREFSIACPEEQQEALARAAVYLDRKMRDVQKGGKVIGLERCAITAALNITHELLDLRDQAGESDEVNVRVKALQEKIDTAMQEQQQLTL